MRYIIPINSLSATFIGRHLASGVCPEIEEGPTYYVLTEDYTTPATIVDFHGLLELIKEGHKLVTLDLKTV